MGDDLVGRWAACTGADKVSILVVGRVLEVVMVDVIGLRSREDGHARGATRVELLAGTALLRCPSELGRLLVDARIEEVSECLRRGYCKCHSPFVDGWSKAQPELHKRLLQPDLVGAHHVVQLVHCLLAFKRDARWAERALHGEPGERSPGSQQVKWANLPALRS